MFLAAFYPLVIDKDDHEAAAVVHVAVVAEKLHREP